MKRGPNVALALFLAGCATVSPEKGHDEVARLVAERAGAATGWEQGPPQDVAVIQRVDALLAAGLTRRNAVAIALLNNPGLQATYEELGVSQAEMVQAGLLKNPTLSGSIGFSLGAGAGLLEPEFSLVQEIVDLVTLSWRKDAAANQFKANTLRVAHEALELAGHVNRAFVTLQAEIENQQLMRQTLQAAQSGHLLAEKQFAAGNITELALGNERATYAQIQLQQTQSDLRVAGAHEHLTHRVRRQRELADRLGRADDVGRDRPQ